MSCPPNEILSLWLDAQQRGVTPNGPSELPEDWTHEGLQAHTAECALCRNECGELQALLSALAETAPEEAAFGTAYFEELRAQTLGALDGGDKELATVVPLTQPGRRGGVWRLAAALAAALALALFLPPGEESTTGFPTDGAQFVELEAEAAEEDAAIEILKDLAPAEIAALGRDLGRQLIADTATFNDEWQGRSGWSLSAFEPVEYGGPLSPSLYEALPLDVDEIIHSALTQL